MNVSGIRSNVSIPVENRPVQEAAAQQAAAPVQDSVSISSTSAAPEKQKTDVELLAARTDCFKEEPQKVIVASGTDGGDVITVTKGENFGIIVDINGEQTNYSFGDSRNLVIDGGKGNDTIKIDKRVGSHLLITGGEGNDYIQGGAGNDTIIDNYGCNTIIGGQGDDTIIAQGLDFVEGSGNMAPNGRQELIKNADINGNVLIGGKGNDYIEGGKGNDLISAGSGNDVVYGLGGNDLIVSFSGQDYVDGGRGNDIIRDNQGNNMIFGGMGDDAIEVGQGRNVVVTGAGHDTLSAQGNATKAYITSGDELTGQVSQQNTVEPRDVPANVVASGSEAFKNRVQSDLEAMASAELTGRMLTGLEDAGKKVSIVDTVGGNKCSSGASGYLTDDRKPNVGSDSTVYYNPSRIATRSLSPWSDRPPLVGLYHEMAHSYNAATGTMDNYAYEYDGRYATDRYGVTGAEFQAVGIDNHTVKQNPEGLSENALRDFLNLPNRDRY